MPSARQGPKIGSPNLDAQLGHEDEAKNVDGNNKQNKQKITFNKLNRCEYQADSMANVRAVATPQGFKLLPMDVDKHVERRREVIDARRRTLWTEERRGLVRRRWKEALEEIAQYGSAWEEGTEERVHAVKAKTRSKKSRAGAKRVKKLESTACTGEALEDEDATTFNALGARANYLAQSRPDLAYSCKERCREFASPTDLSLRKLIHVGKYLLGCPRLVSFYPWHKETSHIVIYSDTDYAVCKVTRGSTSGGVIMAGSHCVKTWSSIQLVLTLSSGEAELVGLAKGVGYALGVKSMCQDLGWKVSVEVRADATAPIGMASRRGTGKVRHLDVSHLWIQRKSGKVT